MSTDATRITREHIEAFISAELGCTAPSSAATRYCSVQQLFKWSEAEARSTTRP